MLEGFYESIVKHEKTLKEHLVGLGFIVIGVLGAIAAYYVGIMMGLKYIGLGAAFFAAFFGFRAAVFHNWEYEYIVTDGTVDIDQIIAKQKRKRMVSFNSRECHIIAPVNRGTRFNEYKSLPVSSFVARDDHPDNYFAVFERVGARTVVIFQPTEDMLEAFKRYNPRNVYTD